MHFAIEPQAQFFLAMGESCESDPSARYMWKELINEFGSDVILW